MKDIDFDELDKAVNSLMASTAPAAEPKPAEVPAPVSPVESAPSPAAPVSPVVPTPVSSEAPATSVPVTVTPRPATPAVRRTGRFMDMVNTPSDSKPRPAAAPSREGLSISPRSEQQSPEVPVVSEAPAAPLASSEPVAETSNMDTMPDPLDMMMEQQQNENVPTSQDDGAAASSASQVPLASESPFITDAKVEKRPLNSESLTDTEPEPLDLSAVVDETPVDEPADETETSQVTDEPPASPQVPELDNELVAIESGASVAAPESSPNDAAAPAVPLGATSIPQQYAAQPSSGDQSHAAIYDASQYPDPIKHPAKSKSGWLWVLWVILLLGVGAGGAVLLYNLGIIG